jgi:hypothetical protein
MLVADMLVSGAAGAGLAFASDKLEGTYIW